MKQWQTIFIDEWRLWRRSYLAVSALVLFTLLLLATSIFTGLRMTEEQHAREHQQQEAEETFLSQPDRHPHRMVHYGHYAFRTPPPLAMVDPGVDAVTGQSIFLEGHRQNSAMFADERAAANTGGFGSLTPAKVYQLLIPLLLIAIGHGVVVRERESHTLTQLLSQGVSGTQIVAGKWVALASVALISLLPLVIASLSASTAGDSLSISLALVATYALYLLVWVSLIVLISTTTQTRGVALGLLVLFWITTAMITPRIGVASANATHPAPGKIETELRMYADKRELGDGHNASDPAFEAFRTNVLAQYNVDTIEELPVNFRGMVAQKNEADLTELMNQYAEEKMMQELHQSNHLRSFGWLSPTLATASASQSLASTGLQTHHRFLRETETLRLNFVQGLNQVHIDKLSYSDDINRNNDEESSRRVRVSSENWKVLEDFEFAPDQAAERWQAARYPLLMLLIWFVAFTVSGMYCAARIKP